MSAGEIGLAELSFIRDAEKPSYRIIELEMENFRLLLFNSFQVASNVRWDLCFEKRYIYWKLFGCKTVKQPQVNLTVCNHLQASYFTHASPFMATLWVNSGRKVYVSIDSTNPMRHSSNAIFKYVYEILEISLTCNGLEEKHQECSIFLRFAKSRIRYIFFFFSCRSHSITKIELMSFCILI